MSNRRNNKIDDGRNLIQLNPSANPLDAEAQKIGGMFTKKALGKFVVYCPPNAILVKENRITGKVTFAKGAGLKFMMPVIYKTHFVLASQVNVDYEKIQYQTADNIDASIDLALFIKVTDPTKYKINSAKPMEDLKISICECLKNYVRERKYEDLVKESFTLSKIDKNGTLKQFEKANGIKVVGGRFKQIELPEKLKKAFDDEVEAKNKQKVMEIENRIQEEAKASELRRVEMEIKQYTKLVREEIPTISDADLMRILKLKFAGNSYFVDGNDRYASDVIKGVVQGESIAKGINNQKANNQKSNNTPVNGVYSYKGGSLGHNIDRIDGYCEDSKSLLKRK